MMNISSKWSRIVCGILIIVIGAIVSFYPILLGYTQDNYKIKQENARTTYAEIVELTDVIAMITRRQHRSFRPSTIYYQVRLECIYSVNGKEYNCLLNYTSTNEEKVRSLEKGEDILIVYDSSNPNVAMIEKTNFEIGEYIDDMVSFIIFLLMGIVVMPNKENRQKGNRLLGKRGIIISILIATIVFGYEMVVRIIYNQKTGLGMDSVTTLIMYGGGLLLYFFIVYVKTKTKKVEGD